MKLPRRHFLHLAAGAAALPAVSRFAFAQAYPSRPVRIVVGFPAGGAPDIIARLVGQVLSERLGQQFVIENRPGAASNIGTEIVVKAPPNGYTLLMVVATNTVNATLCTNLNFNFIRDIAPVASIAGTGQDQHGLGRQQERPPCRGRAVQDDDRYRLGTRAVSWQLLARSSQRAGAGSVCSDAFVDRLYPSRYSACPRSDRRDAFGGSAEHPDRGRVRTGI